jgi:plasmid stabilization system protein ParE
VKLRLTPQAGHDIREISRYLREQNPAVVSRVRSAIFGTLRLLCDFPTLGHGQVEKGIRKFVTGKYPYLIFYRIDDKRDELVVLSVRHPARERPFSDG